MEDNHVRKRTRRHTNPGVPIANSFWRARDRLRPPVTHTETCRYDGSGAPV